MSVTHSEYKAPSEGDLQRLYRELEGNYFGAQHQEWDEVEHFRRVVSGVKVFVDVGASLGQYTHIAGQVMSGGEIFSLEADPLRFDRLSTLCRQWEEQSGNHFFPRLAAVCERDGRTSFFVANANVSGGLFLQRENEHLAEDYNWQEIEVPCMTLDTLLGDEVPDLVKIDVEGAEWRVLDGARRLVAHKRTRFFIEVHPWGDASHGKRPRDIFGFFLRNGYTFKRLGRRWLFQPGRAGLLEQLVALVIGPVADVILRHRRLRTAAKVIAGCFDRLLSNERRISPNL